MGSITIEDWSVVATGPTSTTAVFDLNEAPDARWEDAMTQTTLPPGVHEVELEGDSLIVTCASRVRAPELETLIGDFVDEVAGDL